MRKILAFLAVSSLCLMACSSGNQTPRAATEENVSAEAENADPCGDVMQQIADNCFASTAFQDDGTTPARVVDENGNDVGEVDQEWAAQYCECFAQIARQTFTCEEIVEHEKLDDAAYETTYAEIIRGCTEATLTSAPADEADAAEAAGSENAETTDGADNAENADI